MQISLLIKPKFQKPKFKDITNLWAGGVAQMRGNAGFSGRSGKIESIIDATTVETRSSGNFKLKLSRSGSNYVFEADFSSIQLKSRRLHEGIHGFEHALIDSINGVFGFQAAGDRLGGFSVAAKDNSYMMLVDFSEQRNYVLTWVFDNFEKVASLAAARIGKCKCASGCPSCITSKMCTDENNHLDKGASLEIARIISEGNPAMGSKNQRTSFFTRATPSASMNLPTLGPRSFLINAR